MVFWILVAMLTLLALAPVVWPLLRRSSVQADEAALAASIYRDQLAELDRDQARGALSPAEVQAGRAEIGRRLLAASAVATAPAPTGRAGRWLAYLLMPAIPAAAAALYFYWGSPDLVGNQPAERRTTAAAAGEHDDLRPLVAELQGRLQADPTDFDGWVTLARTQFQLNAYGDAADAYRRALALADDSALRGEFAEALVLGANGIVTEEATALFNATLVDRPGDPRARYYHALGKAQAGQLRQALADWQALVRDSPAGAPWLGAVRDQIRVVAESLGEDPDLAVANAGGAPPAPSASLPQAGLSGASPEAVALARQLLSDAAVKAGLSAQGALASASVAPLTRQLLAQVPVSPQTPATASPPVLQPGPTPEQVAQAATLPPEDQQAMIEGMVSGLAARLEQSPDDLDGWMRLARSYLVIGKPADAVGAYQKAAALAPDRPDVQAAYAEALIMTSADASIPEEAARLLNRVLLLDPLNARALWHMGRLASSQNDKAQARALWTRLLEQIEPGTREHKLVNDALAGLAG